MSAAKDLSRSYPVGEYRVKFVLRLAHDGTPAAIDVEWEPHVPTDPTGRQQREYQGARYEFAEMVSAVTGCVVCPIEFGTKEADRLLANPPEGGWRTIYGNVSE